MKKVIRRARDHGTLGAHGTLVMYERSEAQDDHVGGPIPPVPLTEKL